MKGSTFTEKSASLFVVFESGSTSIMPQNKDDSQDRKLFYLEIESVEGDKMSSK